MKENNFIEKRFLRLFEADSKIKLYQKINAFSRELNGKILSYEHAEKNSMTDLFECSIFYAVYIPVSENEGD